MIAYFGENRIDLEKEDCELKIAVLLGKEFVGYNTMEMNLIIDFLFQSLELPFGCYVEYVAEDILLVKPDIFKNEKRPETKEEADKFFVDYYAFFYEVINKIVYNTPDVMVYLATKDREVYLLDGEGLTIKND